MHKCNVRQVMIRFIYSVLFYSLMPVILLRLLWRGIRSPLYRQRWRERFGFFSASAVSESVIWVHTVSVGETIAAKPFVLQLLAQYPTHQLMITTMTPTGSAQVQRIYAQQLEQGRVLHAYIPYDLPDCVWRFLQRLKPAIAVFMETEVWPNILAACDQRHIPTVLINARLSQRSLKGYQRFSLLSVPAFSRFATVAAQSQADADRIQCLRNKALLSTSVTGNIKSEIIIEPALREQAQVLKEQWSLGGQQKIIIAASTHQGEDEIILSAFSSCLEKNKSLLLIIVPRHPERFDNVYQQCIAQGFITQRRSDQKNHHQALDESTQMIVGDTMGEMMLLCGVADIAVVCGSFIEHGGHNMLEPAAWGVPIVSGKHVFNFATIAADMQKQDALLIADDKNHLSQHLQRLLSQADYARSVGDNAKRYVEKNRGALAKTLSLVNKVLPPTNI